MCKNNLPALNHERKRNIAHTNISICLISLIMVNLSSFVLSENLITTSQMFKYPCGFLMC